MKLERLSENQIRCTLNKADLADRELMLNELAYGTDKAKELFRDMMEQASEELGFEVNDIPLMIEAIPVSPECLILIITKVEDPEELDTRFSRFSKYTDIDIEDEEDSEEDDSPGQNYDLLNNAASLMETISDIVENIEQVKRQNKKDSGKKTQDSKDSSFRPLKEDSNTKAAAQKEDEGSYRIFSFANINEISKAAAMIVNMFEDDSTLYKSPVNNHYYLLVYCKNNTENYQKVCNCLSEYGSKVKSNYATPFYFFEHYKVIIKDHAIETLASI